MTSTNPDDFASVIQRLRLVLEVDSDLVLAEKLGLKTTAWAMRKARGSLPRAEIDAILKKEEINPEFIYNGTGNVHIPVEGASWEDLYRERAALINEVWDYLKPMGHSKQRVAALAKASADVAPYLQLLRDVHHITRVDLTWLITAQRAEAIEYTREERDLVGAYRSASSQGKQFIRNAAGMASGQALSELPGDSQRAGAKSVQIAGSVSGGAVISTGDTHASKAKRR
jgi:hypothetical protein